MLNDLNAIFTATVAKITDATELNVLLNMPFDFYDKATDINFSITFTPLSSKLALQGLIDTNETISELYYDTIENLLRDANVYDATYFLALLSDTIDKDLEERVYSSELHLNNPYFRNGGLDSKEQLEEIVDFYSRNREDINIYKIPWSDIISLEAQPVDINYIHPDLLGAMLPRMARYQIEALTVNKEELIVSIEDLDIYDDQKVRLQLFDVATYAPLLGCRVDFMLQGEKMIANFIYDISEKKIRDVRVRFYKKSI